MPYRSKLDKDEGDIYHGTRVCTRCGVRQDMENFYLTSTKIHRTRTCKNCQYVAHRRRIVENREAYRSRAYVRNLRVKYGLTVDEWCRLYELQGGQCAICQEEVPIEKMHVDHCHNSDEVRGLLCFVCNTGLGKFRDSVALLRNAICYLECERPDITTVSRALTAEEKRLNRSKSIRDWYRSAQGQERTQLRVRLHLGENNPAAKLSDAQVEEIRSLLSDKQLSQQKIASRFGVSQGLVSAIARGKVRAAEAPFKQDVEG